MTRRRTHREGAIVAGEGGFSLVELMIAMVLGLLVIAAVQNMFVGTQRSARFTDGLQSLQENGRFGASVLQRGLRMAGYSPLRPLDAFDMAASGDSAVAVRLVQNQDCNGGPSGADGVVVNTYAHDPVARTITCTGSAAGARPMPLVEQIDGFRVLYGLDEDGDDVPERYVRHDPALESSKVAALRFALLAGSERSIRDRHSSESHVLLDQVVTTGPDGIARAVFVGTVELRNRR